MNYDDARTFAQTQDRLDPLRAFRDAFHIPTQANGDPEIYLCGNSLGLQPKSVQSYLEETLDAWRTLGVKGHFDATYPWLPYHEFLTEKMAALVGALPVEVVTMNSLTVNLHLMMVSFYRPTAERYKILIEAHAFPSDTYAAASQARFHGFDPAVALLPLTPRPGEETLRTEDILETIRTQGHEIALVLLPGVQYYTGQVFEMEAITRAAHAEGCLVGFDLAHAAGNVCLELHQWGVDFAVWCSYKYLNSGPGSLAGCFVHERHAKGTELPRFSGWWGHNKQTRFQMGPDFDPIPGAEGWQLSNPPILSLAAIRASLDVFEAAGGMVPLRTKSKQLTGYLAWLLTRRFPSQVRILTPSAPEARSCQLSLRIQSPALEGKRVFKRLETAGVTGDWREPDVIRVAPTPLYNTFEDVFDFVERLSDALEITE